MTATQKNLAFKGITFNNAVIEGCIAFGRFFSHIPCFAVHKFANLLPVARLNSERTIRPQSCLNQQLRLGRMLWRLLERKGRKANHCGSAGKSGLRDILRWEVPQSSMVALNLFGAW